MPQSGPLIPGQHTHQHTHIVSLNWGQLSVGYSHFRSTITVHVLNNIRSAQVSMQELTQRGCRL